MDFAILGSLIAMAVGIILIALACNELFGESINNFRYKYFIFLMWYRQYRRDYGILKSIKCSINWIR